MSFMGFAGTLGAEWCDYLLADKIAIPPQTLRPWRGNVDVIDQTKDGNNDDDQDDWVYGENIIFTKDTFFCCDHRQSAPDSQEAQVSWPEEQRRRWRMRKELFPDLPDDTVILGNFNQLYKVRSAGFCISIRALLKLKRFRLNRPHSGHGSAFSHASQKLCYGSSGSPTWVRRISERLPCAGWAPRSHLGLYSRMLLQSTSIYPVPVSATCFLTLLNATLTRQLQTSFGPAHRC